jgi:hypothetical protein
VLITPLSDNDVVPFDVDEKPHAILVIFVFKRKVYIMWTRWNDLKTLKEWSRLPELVVDTELESRRTVQKQQEAPLVNLRVNEVHYSILTLR